MRIPLGVNRALRLLTSFVCSEGCSALRLTNIGVVTFFRPEEETDITFTPIRLDMMMLEQTQSEGHSGQ